MKIQRNKKFVKKRNCPSCPEHSIPLEVARLLEKELLCNTGGIARHGLRWVHKDIGVLFFERIKELSVDLYILPTTNAPCRTKKALIGLLSKSGLGKFETSIGITRGGKDLRIKNVEWNDAIILIPILVKWSYEFQTG
jgi:hypothetical protein